jgi:SPOR domain
VKDEDLVVVEADKTPVKDRPQDPGGMKFPNQDKTVFETFAGNAQNPPKVERVMPPPEEPMPKHIDLSETKTWVNEDLKKKEDSAAAKTEQVIGAPVVAPPAPLVKDVAKELANTPTAKEAVVASVQHPAVVAAPAAGDDVISYTKDKTAVLAAEKPIEVGTAEVKTAVEPEPKPEAKKFLPPKTAAALKTSASGVKLQLGAYRSDAEAKAAFVKMQKKFSSLASKKPIVVRADLGAKGIFYRLRVGGFASDAEAKKFCGGLSAKGQACIIAK